MKNSLTLTVILFCISFTPLLIAQCPTSDVTISNLSDLQSFADQYPSCSEISGSLIIRADESVSDLSLLQNIKKVTGDLILENNEGLQTIEHLQLIALGGNLEVKKNDALLDLHGLEGLTRIGGNIEYTYCDENFTSDGLQNVKVLDGSMDIRIARSTHLSGIQLDTIYGDAIFQISPSLNGIHGMGDVQHLEGRIYIYDTKINSLTPFQNLTTIGGLEIVDNDASVSLAALSNVTQILGDVRFKEGSASGLNQLSSLEYIQGSLTIHQNSSLRMEKLTKLKRIDGSINFIKNNLVEDVLGPPLLEYIGGDLKFDQTVNLESITGFNALDTIGGSVIFNRLLFGFDDFTGLNHVKSIGGDIAVTGTYYDKAFSGFASLEEVNGNIKIQSNEENITFNFPPSLLRIGGIDIQSNPLVTEIPDIADRMTGTGDIIIRSNSAITEMPTYPSLTRLDGDLYLQQVFGTVDPDAMLPLLESIGGFLHIEYADSNFQLPNLREVGGNITLNSLNDLDHLDFLSAIDTVHGTLKLGFIDDLTSLQSLANLTHIQDNLELIGLYKVEDLTGLENLHTIGGTLLMRYMRRVKDFTPLSQLAYLKKTFSISNNDSLMTLAGLDNIDIDSFGIISNFSPNIYIKNNPMLSDCEAQLLCDQLAIDATKIDIENNAGKCNDISEIGCKSYGLSGKIYIDLNDNGIQDAGENGIPNMKVIALPSGAIAYTNSFGTYRFKSEEGASYQLSIIDYDQEWQLTTATSTYSATYDPSSDTNDVYHFGLSPLTYKRSIDFDLSSGPTRCNTESIFVLTVTNDGTKTIRTYIEFETDALTTVNDLDPYAILNDEGKYRWRLDSIKPYETRHIELEIQMPSEQLTGSDLTFTYTGIIDSNNTEVYTETKTYESIVLCSYDPNDKQANPIGDRDEHYTHKDSVLKYTVRFQNTGNAPAIDVRIIDTIDTQLDMSTLKVINSSAPVNTIINDRQVEFYFRNIYLPDSLSNPTGSNGFVSYEILPVDTIENFTVIENKADIIFDFNPPIITNTTTNTMVDSLCTDQIEERNVYICDGESYLGHTTAVTLRDTTDYGLYCEAIDITHVIIIDTVLTEFTASVCYGSSYFFDSESITILSDTILTDTSYHQEAGCIDRITHVDISVIVPDYEIQDTVICEGESYLGFDQSGDFLVPVFNIETFCYDTLALSLSVATTEDSQCVDADGDGYPLSEDCNDGNFGVNPDATEIPYNGWDDDCDPLTLDDDLDQDGYLLVDDCNDNDPMIHPGAEEIPGNDIDENCDGSDIDTGTHDLDGTEVTIYPNPAIDYIYVQSSLQDQYHIKLYNHLGAIVIQAKDADKISVSHLPHGSYILEVKSNKNESRIFEKIVIAQ